MRLIALLTVALLAPLVAVAPAEAAKPRYRVSVSAVPAKADVGKTLRFTGKVSASNFVTHNVWLGSSSESSIALDPGVRHVIDRALTVNDVGIQVYSPSAAVGELIETPRIHCPFDVLPDLI